MAFRSSSDALAILKAGARLPSACPVCGNLAGKRLLSAPDRFHHRSCLYSLVRCNVCSMVWLSNPPKPSDMHQHYGREYDRLISTVGEASPEKSQARRRAVLRYKTAGSLLDLGCSSGSFLETFKDEAWKLYGIEISPDAAGRAEARSGARVFVGDVLDAPFPAASFDVITCFDVLEHFYQPRQVTLRIREWLKPGGILYLEVPNIDGAEARIFRSYWYGLELPRHLSHFSPKSLRYLARLAGLEEVSLITARNPAIAYSLRYLCDDLLLKLGLSRPPVTAANPANLPWRILRRVLRGAILRPLSIAVGLAGDGETIRAVLRRRVSEDANSWTAQAGECSSVMRADR